MKFSSKGIPIFPMSEKLESLKYCIDEGHHEDTLGHLMDLFSHVLTKVNSEIQKDPKGVLMTLEQAAAYYGSNPTPIMDD